MNLADAVVTEQLKRIPELAESYGALGRQKYLHDAEYHLSLLAQAIWLSNPALFADYIGWAGNMLEAREVPREHLITHLQCMSDILQEALPKAAAAPVHDCIHAALLRLPPAAMEISPDIRDSDPLSDLAKEYLQLLLTGDRHRACRLVWDCAESGTDVRDIYLYVFQSCQYEIGRLWQLNKITVAQEHYCTAATQLIMAQFYPRIFNGVKNGYGFMAASVAGELHELGPRMVCDFLELAGWDTHYLGANTPTEGILQMVRDRHPHILGVSATLSLHVREVQKLIAAVRSSEHCKGTKLLVGGAAFNNQKDLWRQIGADGNALNAAESVQIAEKIGRL